MDKIEKELKKLTEKERIWIKEILNKLQRNELIGLNIKKLKGRDDIFRIRKGDIRIIYRTEGVRIFILSIERKHEDTYKFLR